MNTTDRLARALGNPRLFLRGFNRLYHRRAGLRSENAGGVHVFDEDWDNLVILDACRYDMFERVNGVEGALTARDSRGSSTAEWLRANVDGRDLRDTVYVTSNPQLERNREQWEVALHKTINVWLDEGWDDETGTVLPETMTEAAIDAHDRFPDKRLVVHYMQPHYPFVPAEMTFDDGHLRSIESGDDSPVGENVWNQKFMGDLEVSRSRLWEAYIANLEYVLEHVESLLEEVPGKTVLTSDHGNFVGERATPIPIREWGHPRGIYDEPLVRVPWLERSSGDRRDVISGSAESEDSLERPDVVTERLRDLGYTE